MAAKTIDLDALAKQHGGVVSNPNGVDYDALAKQFGGTATAIEPTEPEASVSAAPQDSYLRGVGRFLKSTFIDLPASVAQAYVYPQAGAELAENVLYKQGAEQRKQLAEESPEDRLSRNLSYIPVVGTGLVDLQKRARENPHEVAGELAAGALLPKVLPKVAPVVGRVAGEVGETAGRVKNGLVVSKGLKRAAAQVPDAETLSTAGRTAEEIHRAATPELTRSTGQALDRVAAQFGVDTSGQAALSTKAELAGRAAKAKGQALYKQLDQVATEVAGAEGGRFQRYAETVQKLERESLDPALTSNQQEAVAERLANARAEFDAFQQEMVKRGLDEGMIRQANKHWAQGSALDEISRGLLNSEDAFGQIKPTARPLDTPVKKMTAPASGRGHILKQGVGDEAEGIKAAVGRAHQRITADKAAMSAAKKSVKATEESATAAQKRIDKIRGRQKAIGLALAGLAGAGAAARIGYSTSDALSGR